MPRVRSIFISDIHLGTPACQAERLLDFLKFYESEYLFLVGDVVDFWAMRRRGVHWSAGQNTVVQKILKRARHDVKVIFVPGNHDEALREHAGISFGNIRVERDYVHAAADGKRATRPPARRPRTATSPTTGTAGRVSSAAAPGPA